MKKIILMGLLLVLASMANAQKIKESEVPTNVKVTLKKNYPTAKEEKWEKENGQYEVSFEVNEVDYSLLINTDGQLLETEMEITINQLPASVVEYIKVHYAGQKIKEAAKITDAKGIVTYEAEIKGKDLIFDSNGQFIRESKD